MRSSCTRTSSYAPAVATGDLNGDGKADLLARRKETGEWWGSLSVGFAFATSHWDTWGTAVPWVDVQLADFNGDGLADVAGRSKESGTWFVGRSSGSGLVTLVWDRWSPAGTWLDVRAGAFG